ncbi:MAG: sulfite exporter TauE/SafE family protein [Acidobacteriota bacterium]|nr:sulfite exporter TauE/SafE family protein [Blastocatellia bacterium]MDW8240322.1 sulfite exporter TauE/SafE family protein [Acidobacteriota bacterium]
MELALSTFLWIVLVGIATGVMSALLGVGGGFFLVPLLVILFKIPIHYAIGASLITIIATSCAVSAYNIKHRLANVRLGIMLELTATFGAIAGSLLAGRLSHRTLTIVFAGLMVTIAMLMVRKLRSGESSIVPIKDPGPLGASYYDEAIGFRVTYRVQRLPTMMVVFFLAGNLSGLLGIGGALIKVPTLNLICKIPTRAAVATANFTVGLTAVAAALLYHDRGDIPPLLAAATILGALSGSTLGTRLAAKVQSRWISAVFTILTLGLAVQMVWHVL